MAYLREGEGRERAEVRENGTAFIWRHGPPLSPPPGPAPPGHLAMMGGVSMRPMGQSTW